MRVQPLSEPLPRLRVLPHVAKPAVGDPAERREQQPPLTARQ
jgi:hypothetical protein